MPVSLRLTSDQFPHYEAVLNKASIAFNHSGTLITLHDTDFHVILAALEAAHTKSLVLKTKSIVHMERLYNLQNVINRIKAEAYHFPVITLEEANQIDLIEHNDNLTEDPDVALSNEIQEAA